MQSAFTPVWQPQSEETGDSLFGEAWSKAILCSTRRMTVRPGVSLWPAWVASREGGKEGEVG
jgi:hypothetical protein